MIYKCDYCGKETKIECKANFCPVCGKRSSDLLGRSRKTAERYIKSCNEMIPELNKLYDDYVERYVVFMDMMEFIRQYKKRGVVLEEEVPKYNRPSLTEKLKEYRKNK